MIYVIKEFGKKHKKTCRHVCERTFYAKYYKYVYEKAIYFTEI